MQHQLIQPIRWEKDRVILLDQRKLPTEEVYIVCDDYKSLADAIRKMVVRGAPAIGVAAAFGVVLGGMGIGVGTYREFMVKLSKVCEVLEQTRPTAVNLRWALQRMYNVADQLVDHPLPEVIEKLKIEAIKIHGEDVATNKRLGENGADLINNNDNILTHCNAGILATAGWGTALSVVYSAQAQGKKLHVYVDETRPFLQGARLTTWELKQHAIPTTLITDSMAGYLMQQEKINCVIVGADRIAANGDVANKIGTYSLAVLAHHHGIPFYVVAPRSTIDAKCPNGGHIPIEERDSTEVTHIRGVQIAPDQVAVYNPAFDVTPASLITAIITEQGIHKSPFTFLQDAPSPRA